MKSKIKMTVRTERQIAKARKTFGFNAASTEDTPRRIIRSWLRYNATPAVCASERARERQMQVQMRATRRFYGVANDAELFALHRVLPGTEADQRALIRRLQPDSPTAGEEAHAVVERVAAVRRTTTWLAH